MKDICEHKPNVQASNYLKITHKSLSFLRALLFPLNMNNHRCKIMGHNKCSDMANFLEHIVADAFPSKKSP